MRRLRLFPENWAGSSVDDPPILILRLDFSQTNTGFRPIRFVSNRAAVTAEDFIYENLSMNLSIPDEGEKDTPRTTIELSNVNKRLMPALEAGALPGTRLSLRMVQESLSNDPIFRVDMEVESITATQDSLIFSIGYSELLDRAGVRLVYNRRSAPALFE